MKKESFEVAKNQIITYLSGMRQKAFTTLDIATLFHKNREEWRIASYRTVKHFINFLENSNILNEVKLKHLTKGSVKIILTAPNANKYDIGQTIKKDGYISYYSAVQIHQLTLQNPKSIYISFDKYSSDENNYFLLQEAVDEAFSKPQRQTSEIYKSEIDDSRYVFVQKKTNSLYVGVVENEGIHYTNLERTLIDIAVRPVYSGGVFEVLTAFIRAKNNLNSNVMLDYLNELDYVYPYHQLIGFYLDKAGYDMKDYILFLNRKTDIKFYLTYNISNKKLDEKWNIYYPMGFELF